MKTKINSETLLLLRFPFSFFLLPISLFSFYYIRPEVDLKFGLVIFIWHILVFPSSNAYNSFHDRDEGPIGGLKSPPKPTKAILTIANVFDMSAIFLASLIDLYYSGFVLVYILASRLYSNRKIRLKKHPFTGFLIVFVLQGAWVFLGNFFAFDSGSMILGKKVVFPALAASFFIGTIYPLTQIYQHDSDAKDGVRTLSMLLGKRGTFMFSAIMFLLSTFFIYLSFNGDASNVNFILFNLVMLPATLYFLVWAFRSFRDIRHVNFRNTMNMLLLSSFLNNVFFIILLIKK